MSIRLAIIGYGKIAADEHVPALAADPAFDLVALVDPNLPTAADATPATFDSLEALAASEIAVDAVTLAVPPQMRYETTRRAITAGWHVMLEKPPGISLTEIVDLQARADRAGVVLYASWHSRHAPAIAAARDVLADRRIMRIDVDWREDVTVTHPGQQWIWQAGGLGVFDPGINALSILTALVDAPLRPARAHLDVPSNREAPIAAELLLHIGEDTPVAAVFDFRHTGAPGWTIDVTTDTGRVSLADGGARLSVDGQTRVDADKDEYGGVYNRFADCIHARHSDCDLAPFRLVADVFLIGTRAEVDAFHE